MAIDILRHRLHNQRLARTTFTDPADVVAWLGAVQSQDYAGAKWAVGQRVRGATDAAIERAFADGALLRTHVLRPTWHFVAPSDIQWMLALTAPRVIAASMYYYRQQGLDAEIFRRSQAAMTAALRGGKYLTRAELDGAMQQAGITAKEMGLTYIVMRAELDGVICSGPRRGKQFTYALLDERVPPAKPLARDEALAELARRYFTSRGPATVHDYAWWSGLSVTDAKAGLAMISSQLAHEVVSGSAYWFAPSDPPTMPKGVSLLPNYDEYAVAYKDRDAFFDVTHVKALGARENAVFSHVILAGGHIVGTWKRTLKKDAVVMEAQFFEKPTDGQFRAFVTASKRYGAFLGLPVTFL
ncbi:MAG TPA: winged helix DNA-binding domain-containing protein [Ktedonobacterales bacterium]|nr:winged helix DNA-binding domain-containing protein [Ktedonobacterales bacterium]